MLTRSENCFAKRFQRFCLEGLSLMTLLIDHQANQIKQLIISIKVYSQIDGFIYYFVPNCRGGSNKMHQGENYQDLLKWGVVFRSFSYNN